MKIQTYCKKQSDFFIKSKIFFLVVFICERSVVERKITIHIDVGESSSPHSAGEARFVEIPG